MLGNYKYKVYALSELWCKTNAETFYMYNLIDEIHKIRVQLNKIKSKIDIKCYTILLSCIITIIHL